VIAPSEPVQAISSAAAGEAMSNEAAIPVAPAMAAVFVKRFMVLLQGFCGPTIGAASRRGKFYERLLIWPPSSSHAVTATWPVASLA
jgi:hypothetical protein